MRVVFGVILAALMFTATSAAMAAPPAFARAPLHLRAGPGIGFPILRILPRGTQLVIYGCLSDRSWCDVSFGVYRGWVSGAYISFLINGAYRPVYGSGPQISIGVVVWNFDSYWGQHYQRREFYPRRDRYRNIRPGPPRRTGQPNRPGAQHGPQQGGHPPPHPH